MENTKGKIVEKISKEMLQEGWHPPIEDVIVNGQVDFRKYEKLWIEETLKRVNLYIIYLKSETQSQEIITKEDFEDILLLFSHINPIAPKQNTVIENSKANKSNISTNNLPNIIELKDKDKESLKKVFIVSLNSISTVKLIHFLEEIGKYYSTYNPKFRLWGNPSNCDDFETHNWYTNHQRIKQLISILLKKVSYKELSNIIEDIKNKEIAYQLVNNSPKSSSITTLTERFKVINAQTLKELGHYIADNSNTYTKEDSTFYEFLYSQNIVKRIIGELITNYGYANIYYAIRDEEKLSRISNSNSKKLIK